jgi:LytS/YehU family sensor histidine kinase
MKYILLEIFSNKEIATWIKKIFISLLLLYIVYDLIPKLYRFFTSKSQQTYREEEETQQNSQKLLGEFKHKVKMLEKDALLAQAQLDPHFLANELNDIYLLVLKKDDRAAESLRLLCHFMRKMISKDSKGLISLYQEIEILKSYLRYESYCHNIPEDKILVIEGLNEENKELKVPGCLFLPIAENVFKYGDISLYSLPTLKVKLTYDRLYFTTVNFISERRKAEVKSNGIGYKNLNEILNTFLPSSKFNHFAENQRYYTILEIPLKNY